MNHVKTRAALGLVAATLASTALGATTAHAATPTVTAVATGDVWMHSQHSMASSHVEVIHKGHAVRVTGPAVGIWEPVTDGTISGWASSAWLKTTTVTSPVINAPASTVTAPTFHVDASTPAKMLPIYYSSDVVQRYADVPAAAHTTFPQGVTDNGKAIAAAVHKQFPQVSLMGGYRAEADSDHNTGHAIDVMLPGNYKLDDRKALGAAIARWAQENASTLHVSYLIYQQHIWGSYRDADGWRLMADRGSDTANHKDHVHISFY